MTNLLLIVLSRSDQDTGSSWCRYPLGHFYFLPIAHKMHMIDHDPAVFGRQVPAFLSNNRVTTSASAGESYLSI